MQPAELDALADLVVKKLGPRLVSPLRLNRKQMAEALGISAKTLQRWSNRDDGDPCPHECHDGRGFGAPITLYSPQAVDAWLSRQTKKPASANAGRGVRT